MSAQMIELSETGARIALPMVGDVNSFWGLTSVNVEQIGRLNARVKWQSGNILGLEFLVPGDRVSNYIEKIRDQIVLLADVPF